MQIATLAEFLCIVDVGTRGALGYLPPRFWNKQKSALLFQVPLLKTDADRMLFSFVIIFFVNLLCLLLLLFCCEKIGYLSGFTLDPSIFQILTLKIGFISKFPSYESVLEKPCLSKFKMLPTALPCIDICRLHVIIRLNIHLHQTLTQNVFGNKFKAKFRPN